MSQLEEMNISKGYVVRLYKRVTNISEKEIIKNSMFMTWMNFDCMDIIGIDKFQDYNSSINLNELQPKQIYSTRQKFFLYCISERETCLNEWRKSNAFLLKNGVLKNFPLITLTMFEIQEKCQNQKSNGKKKLQYYFNKLKKRTIKGQVYGSLSLYDYVLVLRGNDYSEMDNILNELRENLNLDTDITLNRMYTIAGIDYKYACSWHTDKMKVSIRLSCAPSITSEWLKSNEQLKEAIDIEELYPILGKYDFDIVGRIKSAEKFVSLFLEEGPLSAKRKFIHKSNTRFLKINLNKDKDYKNNIKETIENEKMFMENEFETKVEKKEESISIGKFITLYSKIKGLSSSVQENFSRLILRTFQVIISTNNTKMASDLETKLCTFLDFVYVHQNNLENIDITQDKVEDAFAQMIDIFNLTLDNRVSLGISDFETPQNVLRYSDSSMKVLLTYSDFVDCLVKILSHNKYSEKKLYNRENLLKYLVFVTADPVAKISASVFLSYSKQYRFLNIKIPVDLMFEIGMVLPWITHELGHFIRAGWMRKNRNDAYLISVSRAVINQLIPFRNEEIEAILEKEPTSPKTGNVSAEKENYEELGEKFDSYRMNVCLYFKTTVYKYSNQYNQPFYIPYNKATNLLETIEQITDGLQRIYEESIADMFMLQVLNITDLEDYLNIQCEYFERLHINIQRLPQENVSRIMAVCVVLADLPESDYEQIEEYFIECYNKCCVTRNLLIFEKLKNYKKYYLLEPLVIFLKMYVKNGLDHLLNQNEISGLRQKLADDYKKLSMGTFEDYLNFVLNFK